MAWNDDLINDTPAHRLASTDANTIRAVAGPGSGKTFAIKRRIARLLESGVGPEKILAITFTRTAAQDLKREIESLGIPGAEKVHSGTIHSHALRILMQAEILDRKGRIPRMMIDHEIVPALRDIDNALYGGIREKEKLLSSYLAGWACLQSDDPGYVKDKTQEAFEQELVEWLTEHKGALVGEVIPIAIDYLRNNPASPQIGKYSVILVDEYQDLNRSEQEFIRLIRGTANIVIVGDDDQSIYSFKFAHPEGIREIDKLHGAYIDIPFNECRRCPTRVTLMASALISKNPKRTLGDLKPHIKNNEGIVNIVQWKTYEDEIEGITKIISGEISKGAIKAEDVLVLAPRRRIGYRLRDSLLALGYQVKSYFRESAIEQDNVRRSYSLLNLVANPGDEVSLRYLLGFGSPDYRRTQYLLLKEIAHSSKITIDEALQLVLKGKIDSKGLSTLLREYRKVIIDSGSLKEEILKNPPEGFQSFFVKSDKDEEDFYEVNELYKKAVELIGVDILTNPDNFDNWIKSVFKILQESIALPEIPDVNNHIRIMSLHSSKGLSAKLVILCSMIDHLMPFIPKNSDPNKAEQIIEEGRRLFYVAITRCKSSSDYPGRLIISSFLSIYGVEAVTMGISANPNANLSVSSSRYLKDFGRTSPDPILGYNL